MPPPLPSPVSPPSAPPASPPLPPYYAKPSPPRNFVFSGLGWAYGVGCGAGPFFGMGVAVNNSVLFGAGAGVGVYCGIGFAAGAVAGTGTGFVPVGLSSSIFYAPRLGWAEDRLQQYHLRHQRRTSRSTNAPAFPCRARLHAWWSTHVWPRLAPVFHALPLGGT